MSIEKMKTVRTFPHVITGTIEELRNAELILNHVSKQLRGSNPEESLSHLEINTLAAILEQQHMILTERADLLCDIITEQEVTA